MFLLLSAISRKPNTARSWTSLVQLVVVVELHRPLTFAILDTLHPEDLVGPRDTLIVATCRAQGPGLFRCGARSGGMARTHGQEHLLAVVVLDLAGDHVDVGKVQKATRKPFLILRLSRRLHLHGRLQQSLLDLLLRGSGHGSKGA